MEIDEYILQELFFELFVKRVQAISKVDPLSCCLTPWIILMGADKPKCIIGDSGYYI